MPATNRKGVSRYGWFLIFVINIFAIILLFAGYLSWYVSPAKTTLFAYIGLAFPFILLFNVLFFFFWLVFRKWKFLLISLVSLLTCIHPITTYFPLSIGKKEIPDGSVKFLSYNVRGFNWFDEKDGEENDIIKYIRESDADIVCVQEFMSFERRKDASMNDIKKRLKHYPYHSIVNLRPKHKDNVYGLACFSKYPIVNTVEIPYKSDNGSILFKIDIGGKIIHIVNNHLESNRLTSDDKEMYRKFLKESGTVTFDDLAHNIKERLGIAYVNRAAQADNVSKIIESLNGEKIIVCGDFNDTPISYAYHKIKGDLIDAYNESNFGPDITYNENKFWFKLDFILHSKDIQSYNCTIDKVKYSDHYPIYAYLKIE